ncbi:MAG: hypothetical protein ABR529_03510 [Actinomycetota bacterium]
MADPRLDRIVASLDASFDASIAREEDEAASDLAFSLLQDRSVVEAFRGAGPLELKLEDGASVVASEIGDDYAASGSPVDVIVPLRRAVGASAPHGRPPALVARRASDVLHAWARAGARVDIVTARGTFSGRLVRAAADHFELAMATGCVLVGADAVDAVRRVRGGSRDGS